MVIWIRSSRLHACIQSEKQQHFIAMEEQCYIYWSCSKSSDILPKLLLKYITAFWSMYIRIYQTLVCVVVLSNLLMDHKHKTHRPFIVIQLFLGGELITKGACNCSLSFRLVLYVVFSYITSLFLARQLKECYHVYIRFYCWFVTWFLEYYPFWSSLSRFWNVI